MAGTAPDVALQPDPTPAQPTPAPDLTPVTGAPADPSAIPAPAGSKVVPGDYTGSGAPQAQAPTPQPNNGFRAGVASANPTYSVDESGNVTRSNPTPGTFKGILGGILGGALRGASYGMAAEKGESGAAAAQRLSEQADANAKQLAQRNFENKRLKMREDVANALDTARTISLQQKGLMDQETHAAEMKKIGMENEGLAITLHSMKEGQIEAESAWHAQMAAAGIQPLHRITGDGNDSYQDADGHMVTPGQAGTSGVAGPAKTGSVADLKGAGAKSALAKVSEHAPNITNKTLTMTQNGETGDKSGFNLYDSAKLDDVITKPFYMQLPTSMTHPDGTPVMRDVVIKPDGKTTYRDTRQMLNQASTAIDTESKRLAQLHEQQVNAMKPEKEKADIAHVKAETNELNAKAKAETAGITGGASGMNNPLPAGYQTPTLAELSADVRAGKQGYTVDQLDKLLKSAGVTVAPQHLGALLDVARYDADIKTFPGTHRKGVNDMTQQEAESIITKYINPNFNTRDSIARTNLVKELAAGRGVGATRDRLNTAIQHMQDWSDAVQALPQNNLLVLNQIAGHLGLQTGNDALPIYNAIRDKLAAEQAGAIKGGSGSATDQEIDKAVAGMRYDLAPDQQSGVIRTQANLLKAAGNTFEDKFTDAFGGIKPEQTGHSMYFRDNRQKLDGLSGISTQQLYNRGNAGVATPADREADDYLNGKAGR